MIESAILYLIEWGHHYLVHFGAWMSFAIATTIYKNGLPEPKMIKGWMISATILAATVSLFSSHSHMHYLSHFLK